MSAFILCVTLQTEMILYTFWTFKHNTNHYAFGMVHLLKLTCWSNYHDVKSTFWQTQIIKLPFSLSSETSLILAGTNFWTRPKARTFGQLNKDELENKDEFENKWTLAFIFTSLHENGEGCKQHKVLLTTYKSGYR